MPLPSSSLVGDIPPILSEKLPWSYVIFLPSLFMPVAGMTSEALIHGQPHQPKPVPSGL